MRVYKDTTGLKAIANIHYATNSPNEIEVMEKSYYRDSSALLKVFDKAFDPNDIMLYWRFDNKTNESPDRSRIIDLAGNYDGDLYGFNFAAMSGYNGFLQDLTTWEMTAARASLLDESTVLINSMLGPAYTPSFRKTGNNVKFRFKVSGVTSGMQLYFGIAVGAADRVSIPSDGEYEYTSTAQGTHAIRSEITPVIPAGGITIEQLPEHPGALVFDGIVDYVRSISSLPAFENDNYAIIFAWELLDKTKVQWALQKGQTLLGINSYGGIVWHNLNGGATKLVDDDVIGITNNIAYNDKGRFLVNDNPATVDVQGLLYLGNNTNQQAGQFAKMALKSIVVLRRNKYFYESVVNIYKRLQADTLIPYTLHKVLLSVNNSAMGSVTGNGFTYNANPLTVLSGKNMTVVANPSAGYRFVSYTDLDTAEVITTSTYTFAANTDRRLRANFETATVNINVSSSDPAKGTVSVNFANPVVIGTSVTITANAISGNKFVEWRLGGVAVQGAGASYTFNASANANYQAVFAEIIPIVWFPMNASPVTNNVGSSAGLGNITPTNVALDGNKALFSAGRITLANSSSETGVYSKIYYALASKTFSISVKITPTAATNNGSIFCSPYSSSTSRVQAPTLFLRGKDLYLIRNIGAASTPTAEIFVASLQQDVETEVIISFQPHPTIANAIKITASINGVMTDLSYTGSQVWGIPTNSSWSPSPYYIGYEIYAINSSGRTYTGYMRDYKIYDEAILPIL